MTKKTEDLYPNIHLATNTLKLKTWRLCNAVMSLFFIICAGVQHNDPDPELWMVCWSCDTNTM